MTNLPWIRLDVELLYIYWSRVNKTENGENEVFEGENKEDITVVLDVGDVGVDLGLAGGDIEELGLDLGVNWDLRQQLISNVRAVYKVGLSWHMSAWGSEMPQQSA